jgi:hypothetical protein
MFDSALFRDTKSSGRSHVDVNFAQVLVLGGNWSMSMHAEEDVLELLDIAMIFVFTKLCLSPHNVYGIALRAVSPQAGAGEGHPPFDPM